jgi:hypothetical protein
MRGDEVDDAVIAVSQRALRRAALLLVPLVTACMLDVTGTIGGDAEPDAGCAPGLDQCGSQCVDTDTDRLNCGGCGETCDVVRQCVDGACRCTPPLLECDGACVDTATDRAHCGGCETACDADQQCLAGACSCPAGEAPCGGRCVDTDTDSRNCGGCGVACTAPQVCDGTGHCATSCSEGSMPCTTPEGAPYCADLAVDTANCGSCGFPCPARANAVATCVVGICDFDCNASYVDLNDTPDDGCECRWSGEVCNDADDDCDNGIDEDFDCRIGVVESCASEGEGCTGQRICTAACTWSGCTAACADPIPDCCAGLCTSLDDDEANCGSCGRGCLPGETCCDGGCVECCTDAECDDGRACTIETCDAGTHTCSQHQAADTTACAGGICCGGLCDAGAECCVAGDCAAGPACRGDVSACSNFYWDSGRCESQLECHHYPIVGCIGTPVGCGDLGARCRACGCLWDDATGLCTGSPHGCAGWDWEGSVTCGHCGCDEWTCLGTPRGCDQYSCANQEGCAFTPAPTCVDGRCR